jgi:hypothetical protein
VTIVTNAWFFDAERIIAGPPMSMFSMISSRPGAAHHRLLERVEVRDQQVDRADLVRVHRRGVVGIVAHREQPAVDQRVERLDAARPSSRGSR